MRFLGQISYVVFCFLGITHYCYAQQDSLGNSVTTLTSGLVAYYPLDGDAQDASGNGNHGIVIAARPTTDRFGQEKHAYLFDGSLNFIKVPYSTSLNVDKHTLVAWISPNINGTNVQNIIGRVNPTVFETISLALSESLALRTNFATGEQVNNLGFRNMDGAKLNPAQWTWVAMSYDGERVSMYVNGMLDTRYPRTGSTRVGTNSLAIGRHGGDDKAADNYFNGSIDDVRIYNRALSEIELQALYSGQTNPCMASYSFETGDLTVPCLMVVEPIDAPRTWQLQLKQTSPAFNFDLDLMSLKALH